MIVANQKPLEEILTMTRGLERLAVIGCNSCVTVCMAGGEKEVAVIASALRLAAEKEGRPLTVEEAIAERQCEDEFCEKVREKVEWADAVLSLACSVGAQTMTRHFPERVTLPGLNTTFFGEVREPGLWMEMCAGCGDCVIHLTGGFCPVARCAKRMLNGPCGGSQGGKCEVDKETDCVWQQIYDRMVSLGRLDELMALQAAKDWRAARDGGPRKRLREDARK
jgi:ferredoxin